MSIRPLLLACVLSLCSVAVGQDAPKPAADAPALKTPKHKVSYGIGRNIGTQMLENGMDLNVEAFTRGLIDGLKEQKSPLSEDELEAAMMSFQKDLRRAAALKRIEADPELKAVADKNAKEGKAFLDANAKKEGVKTTASGLQYQVVKVGTGKSPKATDKVLVHYHGTLPDGTVFDSSVERKEPIDFPLNGVIEGWTEGLQLMKEGGKMKLFVPSALAYDLQQKSAKIGPNQVLVFEVELIELLDQ